MAAKGIDRQLSFEDLESEIETYFREASKIEYQRKKNDIIDNLRKSKVSIAEEDLARQAELVLTVPRFSFQVQGVVGESDEYIRYVNNQNIAQKKKCKYLNLIIPGTEEQRMYEIKEDELKLYYSEDMDVIKRIKANETFMNQLSKKLKCGDLEDKTKVVKTKMELEKAVTNFVLENKCSYWHLFITLNCHGSYEKETNYGTIITHGEVYRNAEYIDLLKELSQAHNIEIDTLMGQCYSHLNAIGNTVSLKGKVTVYATTTAESPTSIISIAPVASYSEQYQVNIVDEIVHAEHLGYTKYVSDLPQPNPNPSGQGQDPGGHVVGSLVAGGGVAIQPGVSGGDSLDMDTI